MALVKYLRYFTAAARRERFLNRTRFAADRHSQYGWTARQNFEALVMQHMERA